MKGVKCKMCEFWEKQDCKFKRGQIWLLKGEEAHKTNENGENGTRPVLIISNDTINRSNFRDITVIPCTTITKRENLCTNVTYYNNRGIKNIIQTGNLMNINKEKLICYLATLDDVVIEKVEKALRIFLGLDNFDGNYYGDCGINSSVQNNNETIEVENELPTISEFMQTKIDKALDKHIAENLVILQNNKNDDNEIWNLQKWKNNSNKIKWTTNRELEFMKYYEELGAKEFSQATGMKIKTATQRAYLLKKKYPEFLSRKKVV